MLWPIIAANLTLAYWASQRTLGCLVRLRINCGREFVSSMAPKRRGPVLAQTGPRPLLTFCSLRLNVEGRSAAAGALHVRVVELEAGAFQRFQVVNADALQVHQRGRVDENLQAFEVEGLVHHAGAVFERHRVGEAGAASAYHSDTQSRRNRILLRHDLLHLRNSV